MIKETNKLTGKLNASIIHVYPELEDITITPQLEEQVLKSEKYGFDDIIVEGIPATEIEIQPTFEEQTKEGIFKEVKVGAIPQQTLNITPTEQEQTKTGIFTEVNIDAIQAVEIAPELNFDATNSIVLQGQDGTYMKKVTLNKDVDLIPDNIKTGVTIFGVQGGVADTADATATANDLVKGTTAYVNNKKVTGTIPDNGTLEFEPSDNEQEIPSGLTTGGVVKAADITTLNEYNACLTLANSIEDLEDYSDTTATAEDIVEGKTAYSNGEKITGTLKNKYNAEVSTTIQGNPASSAPRPALSYIKKISGVVKVDGNSGDYIFRECSNLEEVEIEILNDMSLAGAFQDCFSLKKVNVLNSDKINNYSTMFKNCQLLEEIHDLDTSKSLRFYATFDGCSNLKRVGTFSMASLPLRDNMVCSRMFADCASLTDESLNNILISCTTARSNVSGKTLQVLGLTSEQAERCKSLPNYQAFLNAGWTTGY